jgi:glycosyltransferase involved in cell wall biosynthesis
VEKSIVDNDERKIISNLSNPLSAVPRLAIVTQDPANYGGVLRLVEYIYKRAEAIQALPTIVHYARFTEHPELNVSCANILRGELNAWPESKNYEFHGMRAHAIGALFPEWEPNRIRANHLWRRELKHYDGFLLVTGSAHTGLPLVQLGKPFAAWISSTVDADRAERLKHGILSLIERWGLPIICKAENRVLNTSEQIFAVSDDARSHIGPLTGKPIQVLPFPIDTEQFKPGHAHRDEQPIRFLFVGRANDPRKRIDLFFEACEILQAMPRSFEFSIAVVSTVLPDIKPYSFKLEQYSSISENELLALYRSSTAFVLTSEQEGLGIAAMEAMACGLPVVSTRCGGPEMFIADKMTGYFVDSHPQAVAKQMYELAANAELRTRMGAAASERIQQDFSERVWNPKFEALLAGMFDRLHIKGSWLPEKR